jgi:hypothetical protein
MSERKPTEAADPARGEPFLQRWSKRKAQARTGVDEQDVEPVQAVSTVPPGVPDVEQVPPEPVVLPDLDSLGEDSDYSAFLAPGVDENLRRLALRKLFRSPKFNVCDGLDDYCEDFTQFEALGDLVTADMKHHLERAARAAAKVLEDATQDEHVAAVSAKPAAAAASPAAATAAGEKGEHDEPDPPA